MGNRPRTFRAGSLAALALLTLASEAHANDVPSLDLRGFDPPTDPNGGLRFESAASPETGDFNAGLWTSYGYRQIALRRRGETDAAFTVLAHQITGDFVANVGLFNRLAVGVQIPFVWWQSGGDPTTAPNNMAYATLGSYTLPSQALGDLKLVLKGTLVRPTRGDASSPNAGFSLALLERLGLPTGDETSFLGEGRVTSETRLLASYDMLAFGVHGSVGAKLRSGFEDFACNSVVGACPTRFGHEMPFNLAVAFRPQAFGIDRDGHWQWFAETYGRLPVYPRAPFSNAGLAQVQVGVGARYTFDSDVSLLGGVDVAAVSGIGAAPVRGTVALGWAPRSHDIDGDGVLDRDDQCPELVEDRDGFEDTDGCPDIDNDEDGVKDMADRCDGQKEDEDGFLDDDGCPDPDNDGDGILDAEDHCPMVPGVASANPLERGCPDPDSDRDGVKGTADRCPAAAEDRDGFQDDDGCPDPDNDGDGIADGDDRCRDVSGVASSVAEANGCPDGDGDGVIDSKDACPTEKGVTSDDPTKSGCAADEAEDPKKKGKGKKGKKDKKDPKAAKAAETAEKKPATATPPVPPVPPVAPMKPAAAKPPALPKKKPAAK